LILFQLFLKFLFNLAVLLKILKDDKGSLIALDAFIIIAACLALIATIVVSITFITSEAPGLIEDQ